MSAGTLAAESARTRLLAGTPVSERTVTAAGVQTAVLEGGDGPPLLLLHGPGEFAAGSLPVLGDLVRSHRVVAPDLPGHGASTAPSEPMSREWIDSWVGDLIAATCHEPPALVGRVVGGAIGACFAATHQDRLSHLVLVDTIGLEPFDPDPRFGLAMHRFLADPSAATYERFMDLCAFDLDTVKARLGRHWAPYAQYAVQLAGDPGVQSAIRVPTTMIWGREDAATPLPVAEQASVRYGWPLHVIDRAGDDPALDRPAEFLDILLGVLGREARS